ncbi:uncharacterized protein BO97DRAFT_211106 [Aspergillus homomorphus CBS 101889]|uniref:Uncharacterized protein n=1 Tax=Aspergillus homomorphus (strain CBS 101889) TaxID=1450537 RepID=A0A395I8N4_ASPHC|nr:hypothetical protein BO97DRAFT_211106 [Aspergillus homomorphus CBS 101889]RAL15408.1 hypothetical protein BO97DRAFT_211106 [Aspergillus homomorphus CBS 101889]
MIEIRKPCLTRIRHSPFRLCLRACACASVSACGASCAFARFTLGRDSNPLIPPLVFIHRFVCLLSCLPLPLPRCIYCPIP